MTTTKKAKSERKHDRLCEIIREELDARGFISIKNVEYISQRNGEIDVAGFHPEGDYAIDVEVKCNDKYNARTKAYDQLDRAEKHFEPFQDKRLFKMYAHYTDDGYRMMWYK